MLCLTLFLETLSSPFYHAMDSAVDEGRYFSSYIIYCTYLLKNYVEYPFELNDKLLQAQGIVET